MDHREFQVFRQKLGKTQKQLSELLGTSLKAIQSFEQGWRRIPAHVERRTLFLLAMKMGSRKQASLCWEIRPVLLRCGRCVRLGNLKAVIRAGSSTAQFARENPEAFGVERWSYAESVRSLLPS